MIGRCRRSLRRMRRRPSASLNSSPHKFETRTHAKHMRALPASLRPGVPNKGISELAQVRPVHVAAYIEGLQKKIAAPSVKLKLAAIRMLFDWLVVGQVVPSNPASSVRGPKHVVRKGKTPVLSVDEARELLAGIDVTSLVGLRDRALVALMVYTFARIGAAIKMRVEDVYIQGRRTWVRLHEKGGKRHDMPCHHSLEEYLEAYIKGAGIAADGKGYLFRTARGRSKELTDRSHEPGGCLPHDPAPRGGREDTDQDRLP